MKLKPSLNYDLPRIQLPPGTVEAEWLEDSERYQFGVEAAYEGSVMVPNGTPTTGTIFTFPPETVVFSDRRGFFANEINDMGRMVHDLVLEAAKSIDLPPLLRDAEELVRSLRGVVARRMSEAETERSVEDQVFSIGTQLGTVIQSLRASPELIQRRKLELARALRTQFGVTLIRTNGISNAPFLGIPVNLMVEAAAA